MCGKFVERRRRIRPVRGLASSAVPAAPQEIEWSRLSPAAIETAQIGFRLSAGYSFDEIAEQLDRVRPEFRHQELPPAVTKGWVARRVADLRDEIERTGAASY